MRKKRILFCTEATFLNTGYATYTREILNYLNSTGKYELAELAAYGKVNDERAIGTPWKFYGVMPADNASKEEHQVYSSHPSFQFGENRFEDACLNFKPDVVCDIRDFWMVDFIERSPFRPFFKWCLMPTVDARPQARQWIATYKSADACLSYSDWSGGVLKDQSGGQINYLGSAPPSAHPAYQPIQNKEELKKSLRLDPNCKIIGTVMRNQRRKLYPDLFAAFKSFLGQVSNPEQYFLYCHTSYPDMGWDIPELLQTHKLSSKVYFTYVCADTKRHFASLFKGAMAQSPFTQRLNAVLPSVRLGLEYQQLAEIINSFDLYAQYANSEGFGLPQVEAAACGVPVCGTDYSAMESILRQLEGYPIKPKALYKELETGCLRAVPDNEEAVKVFLEFFKKPESIRRKIGFNTRQKFKEIFQWDKSGKVWESYFDSVEMRPHSETWDSPARFRKPHKKPSAKELQQIPFQQLSRWLIQNVLCDNTKVNSYLEDRMGRDLMYGSCTSSTGGIYENEASVAFEGNNTRREFNFEIAYNNMFQLCNKHNFWEQKRMEKLQ
jgi:glycosyltransferase involved in cell wall biosynthesis